MRDQSGSKITGKHATERGTNKDCKHDGEENGIEACDEIRSPFLKLEYSIQSVLKGGNAD